MVEYEKIIKWVSVAFFGTKYLLSYFFLSHRLQFFNLKIKSDERLL